MTDPIADALTRLRNAYLAHQSGINLPHSNLKEALMLLLKKAQYVSEVKVIKKTPQKELQISLHYINKLPAITQIKRISKPGRRAYVRSGNLKPVLSGQGLA